MSARTPGQGPVLIRSDGEVETPTVDLSTVVHNYCDVLPLSFSNASLPFLCSADLRV